MCCGVLRCAVRVLRRPAARAARRALRHALWLRARRRHTHGGGLRAGACAASRSLSWRASRAGSRGCSGATKGLSSRLCWFARAVAAARTLSFPQPGAGTQARSARCVAPCCFSSSRVAAGAHGAGEQGQQGAHRHRARRHVPRCAQPPATFLARTFTAACKPITHWGVSWRKGKRYVRIRMQARRPWRPSSCCCASRCCPWCLRCRRRRRSAPASSGAPPAWRACGRRRPSWRRAACRCACAQWAYSASLPACLPPRTAGALGRVRSSATSASTALSLEPPARTGGRGVC